MPHVTTLVLILVPALPSSRLIAVHPSMRQTLVQMMASCYLLPTAALTKRKIRPRWMLVLLMATTISMFAQALIGRAPTPDSCRRLVRTATTSTLCWILGLTLLAQRFGPSLRATRRGDGTTVCRRGLYALRSRRLVA